MPTRDRPLYAVLIDADNIPAKFAGAILKEIAALGEPALRRVYGDWSSGRLDRWSKEVRGLGLVAHQETANTVGKNASDIGLVIDAMDILHTGRFDGFVLVSSDSDSRQPTLRPPKLGRKKPNSAAVTSAWMPRRRASSTMIWAQMFRPSSRSGPT